MNIYHLVFGSNYSIYFSVIGTYNQTPYYFNVELEFSLPVQYLNFA